MAHAIETFADGTAAFFTNREPAWHKLGVVTPNALTAAEALTTAQLDWTVTKEPINATVLTDDGVTSVPVNGKWATVRQHPKTGVSALGVVGDVYEVVQNTTAFEIANDLFDEGGAHFETAGSLFDGRKVFLTMKMPSHVQIGGQDVVDMYLLLTNTHDGTASTATRSPAPSHSACPPCHAPSTSDASTRSHHDHPHRNRPRRRRHHRRPSHRLPPLVARPHQDRGRPMGLNAGEVMTTYTIETLVGISLLTGMAGFAIGWMRADRWHTQRKRRTYTTITGTNTLNATARYTSAARPRTSGEGQEGPRP